MTPPYPLTYTLQLISTQVSKGHIIMGLDEEGEPGGIVTYYYGNPDNDFQDRESLLVEILLIKKEYRKTTAFFQGLEYLINGVTEADCSVSQVFFYAHADSAYLRRLYSKFANPVAKREGEFGELDVYSTSLEALSAFIRSFHRHS
jgi:hypothetical protein